MGTACSSWRSLRGFLLGRVQSRGRGWERTLNIEHRTSNIEWKENQFHLALPSPRKRKSNVRNQNNTRAARLAGCPKFKVWENKKLQFHLILPSPQRRGECARAALCDSNGCIRRVPGAIS